MLGPTLPATSGAKLNSDSTVDIEIERSFEYQLKQGMTNWNNTEITEFLLMGLFVLPHLQYLLFSGFLLAYLTALCSNLTILLVTFAEPLIYTPMYFFLSNLSLIDLALTSSILPKLLHIYLTGHRNITYVACMTQVVLSVICVVSEFCLLAAMAHDRVIAICLPLRYTQIMKLGVCVKLAITLWLLGVLEATVFMCLLSQFSFCRSNVINHFFCHVKPLLQISCSATQSMESAIAVSSALFGFMPLLYIIITYIIIIATILKIRSSESKRKAFSTCSSHLTVVILTFGLVLGMYLSPESSFAMLQDKVFSLLYTLCLPIFNPLIYSLRNKDIKQALQKLKENIVR
ncbi:olfactory receptor 5AR1-like [Pelobates fuscus]|uniref:olfactory receptor 5AR1-like n=1 Tax=Pelobates fuscus TaxID=191477 RepID=UPI002FE4B149